jgi:hypothetical protein
MAIIHDVKLQISFSAGAANAHKGANDKHPSLKINYFAVGEKIAVAHGDGLTLHLATRICCRLQFSNSNGQRAGKGAL